MFLSEFISIFLSYSDSLSEVFLHWIFWSPKLPRVCVCWVGWWGSDKSLWQYHQQKRTQTGLDEQSQRIWSSVLGEANSDLFGSPAVVQSQHWHFEATLQPNWRFVYFSLCADKMLFIISFCILVNTHTHTLNCVLEAFLI